MDVSQRLSAFPKYLEEHRLADPRHISFLVRWIEPYLRTPHDPSLIKPEDRLKMEPVELRPTEFSAELQGGNNLTVYRLDFAARVTRL